MNLARLHGSARTAGRWLREHLADNGQWKFDLQPCIDIYYKAPWCFAASGDPVAAGASLAHIEQAYLRSDGDLGPSGNPVIDERHAFYQHAFVAIGARLGGRLDMAARMLDFLAAQQHPVLGAWGSRADAPSRRCDTISTAAVGLAFVEDHRLAVAEKAAGFLRLMLDRQPRPESGFFTSTNPDGVLLTPGTDERESAERHVRFTARGQLWWALGFPLVFLARLYEESGDPMHLETCLRYLGLVERCPQAWNDASSGKLAAGCAVLYRVTGERRHRANALRAATALVARQNAVGAWYRVRKGPGPRTFQPSAAGLEISTEFAHWLALVTETLAEGDRARGLPPLPTEDETAVARWLRQAERVLLQRKLSAGQRWHGWKAGLRRRILHLSART